MKWNINRLDPDVQIIKMQDGSSAGKVCDLYVLTERALEWLELDQRSQETYQYKCYAELFFSQPIPGAFCE